MRNGDDVLWFGYRTQYKLLGASSIQLQWAAEKRMNPYDGGVLDRFIQI